MSEYQDRVWGTADIDPGLFPGKCGKHLKNTNEETNMAYRAFEECEEKNKLRLDLKNIINILRHKEINVPQYYISKVLKLCGKCQRVCQLQPI